MQKLELFDETFDPDRTESYELSIQVSLDGFSFCIKDLTRNCFIGLGSCPFELGVSGSDDWFKQVSFMSNAYKWIGSHFKRVLFSFVSRKFTIVPKELFVAEEAKNLLAITHRIDDLDEVRFNSFLNGTVSIFSVPSNLVNAWLNIQKKSRVIGYCDPHLQFHQLGTTESEVSITISFGNNFALIIVSFGNKLLHCGSIETQTVEDTLYHMMNICKSLSVEPSKAKVITMGYHNDYQTMESMVGRFFGEISTSSKLQQNHFSYLLNQYKGKFASLFNQTLCE